VVRSPLRTPTSRLLALGLAALAGRAAAQDFVVRPPAESFRDVAPGHWAYEAVEWLRSEGLLEGWGERFHGRRSFTRYEMAEILARYTQRLLEAQRELTGLGNGSPRAGSLRSEVEHLRQVVERIAKVVSTHQALLEDPGAQRAWRKRMETLRKRRRAVRSSLRSEAPPGRRRDRAPPKREETRRKRRLLAALDRLQASKGPPLPVEPADDFVYFGSDPRPPARSLLARAGQEEHLPVRPDLPASRRAPRPSPPDSAARAEAIQERLDGLLALSRVMRGPGGPALPGPRRTPRRDGAGKALNRRLVEALDEVRQGAMDPERARVIGYLASLALEAERLER